MNWTQRIINSLRPPAGNAKPRPGRLLQPRTEDSWRDYPSSNLSPKKLMSILREADAGALSSAMQLYEEMEEKDAHLYAVANTRRLAVTGLEWSIQPDPRVPADRSALADETARHCREVLTRLDGFDDALQHLSLATGRNIAVAELVWGQSANRLTLIDVVPVDFTRLVFDDLDQPRILTDEEPIEGIAIEPNKFVVHAPQCTTGHAARGGLLRVTALVYLAKNLALKDWMIFAEVFGMPVRIARYEPSASPEEKRELLNMLESLGSNAAGIFSRAVDLQIVESSRSGKTPPFETLIDFLNREMSKAWLGQTLTTDTTGSKGTFAASSVHDRVRRDILIDDLRKEARTIRRNILTPLVRFRFGAAAPIPNFVRRLGKTGSVRELAELLSVAVNELGARVPRDWAHESLGIPVAADGTAILESNAS